MSELRALLSGCRRSAGARSVTTMRYEIDFSAYKTTPQRWWKYGNTSKPDDLTFSDLAEAQVAFGNLAALRKQKAAYPRMFRLVEVKGDQRIQIGEVLDCELDSDDPGLV